MTRISFEGKLLAVERGVDGYTLVVEYRDAACARRLSGLDRSAVQGLVIGQQVRVTVGPLETKP